jgi:hypothetical protein
MAVKRDVHRWDALSRGSHFRRETFGEVSGRSTFLDRAYLEWDIDTTVAGSCRNNLTPHHRLQTYYGYSFESFCTAGTPHEKPGWGGDVETNIQWCSVVKTKLGNTRLVIGGEVDCVRGAFGLLTLPL